MLRTLILLALLIFTFTGCDEAPSEPETTQRTRSTAAELQRGLKRPKIEQTEQRVALIIGNNAYERFSVLKNPSTTPGRCATSCRPKASTPPSTPKTSPRPTSKR